DALPISAGGIVIALAAVFSIGGNLASIMLAVPRLTFALSEQRLLPRWFGEVHEKHATPANSIVFLGVLGTVFALTGSFVWLAAASSLTRLISYALCIASLPIIRQRADEQERAEAFRLIGGYTIPCVALILCLWIMFQSSLDAWAMTGGLLAAGLVLYWFARQRPSVRRADT
ncbi:MAG: APC family permease, partial [Woeseia sp.]